MSYYEEYKPRKQEGIWHFLNRLLFILIVFAVITLIICAFMSPLRQQREQVERLDDLKKQIEAQKAILDRRKREVDLLKNDPSYVEVLARDRLDLMKDGETIFRMDPSASPSASKLKLRSQ